MICHSERSEKSHFIFLIFYRFLIARRASSLCRNDNRCHFKCATCHFERSEKSYNSFHITISYFFTTEYHRVFIFHSQLSILNFLLYLIQSALSTKKTFNFQHSTLFYLQQNIQYIRQFRAYFNSDKNID